ncbi:hypothetical protein [Ekhidna sp.]
MFENLNFPVTLDENQFDEWLIYGRESKIRYNYLVILWDEMEKDYRPVYLTERKEFEKYTDKRNVNDVLVAGYDLFTESKVL